MSGKRCRPLKNTFSDIDDSWEEEIERLKHDIKKTERKVLLSEKSKLTEKARLHMGHEDSDDSLQTNIYSSPIERIVPARKLTSTPRIQTRNPIDDCPNAKHEKELAQWVTPCVSKVQPPKEDILHDAFLTGPESSFDCGSSIISLDYGLVSPNKNWSSPPQRIERAHNREWSSPHRVIDRPNPENSPGNWISMKESCFTVVRHSPTLGGKAPTVDCPFQGLLPNPEPRPASQTTYVIQEPEQSEETVAKTPPPVRKTSVLENYEPERAVLTKKRTICSPDAADAHFQPTNDKIRRLVDSRGHVIKISVLDDFKAPPLGKPYGKGAEGGEKENVTPSAEPIRTRISSKLSPSVMKPPAKRKKVTEKGGNSNRLQDDSVKDTNKNTEEGEDEETNANDLDKDTQRIIKDLEKILKEPDKEMEKSSPKGGDKGREDVPRRRKSKAQEREDQPIPVVEKRKRNIDPKSVQEYIKSQKQKRLEQVKTEKKTKDAEKEARKKKLEELRIRTLKLATQSKKKKSPQQTIKVVEPEDDVTQMSLGLKQTKPKVSYNESISKLKKKAVGQQKPQSTRASTDRAASPAQDVQEKTEEEKEEEEEEEKEEKEEKEKRERKSKEEEIGLKKPEETIRLKPINDLNETLKKLAESLHLKLDEKEKQLRSRPSSVAPKSAKDSLSAIASQETIRTVKSVKSAPEATRQVVSVDVGTIQSLKDDIKRISENFKVLHEIIVDKAEFLEKSSAKVEREQTKSKSVEAVVAERERETNWFESVIPRPHPYNVFTAFKQKMNLKGSSSLAEPPANKYDSDFEALSVPSDRLRSMKQTVSSVKTTSIGTSEENYYTLKDDSGSEFSSSILDSDKQTSVELSKRLLAAAKGSRTSSTVNSVITEITSSVRMATSKSISSRVSSEKESFVLVPPDVKLIADDQRQRSITGAKSDSTITELIEQLSENEKSEKSVRSGKEEKALQRVEEVHMRRSFFRPEMLHLQFQAELTLLETFQQSLAHFLEAERLKTLTEVNKIVHEKAIGTEKFVEKEEQGVQTKESSRSSSETESVKTEINLSEASASTRKESVKAKTAPRSGSASEGSENLSTSKETLKDESRRDETLDLSNGHSGISFQMLERMMKDEELRSEHQLALIKLREKTLNEKIKAELTFLEMKKRALKEGGEEEQSVSAIKKKQRGILLKYQSEKEEIERLKKMHKIASEERKIMIKQQKQIQQMQMTTKDMIIRLKKREKSPKKAPLKPKALKSSDSQSDIPEEIPIVSDSIFTGSCSMDESTRHSDLDVSSRSNVSDGESEILRRNMRTLESKVSSSIESFKSKKSFLETEKYPRKRHSVEELLNWTKRLEEKENNLKELERQAMSAANSARSKATKSLKKISMRDRSTSPLEFQENVKTTSVTSPTEETKKSSTISEAIESNPRTETTEKSEWGGEKTQRSASDETREESSKKTSTSRTEYYSESFESPSSSETPKAKPEMTKNPSSEGYKGIVIKMSLSPRMQSSRRRCSSGSDESLNLSHTETASEQSDLESRIAALNEQLRKRKLEAERLRREQKKAQRERLRVKEQSLLKQIQAYDAYIQKKKQELELEQERSTQVLMKPLIKQPRVAEKAPVKQMPINETEKPDTSQRLGRKEKEKDKEESISEKISWRESESEIMEQVKETSESIAEEIREESGSVKEERESRTEEEEEEAEEEEESKITESYVEAEVGRSTSVSESLAEQEAEGSQSESEEQSISIKTTVQSPEKAEGAEWERVEEESVREDYQLDSFESEAEEKESRSSEMGREVEEEVEEVDKTKEAEKITDAILMELILESLQTFTDKRAEAERRLAEESKLTLEALSAYLAKEVITEAVDDIMKVYNKKMAEEKRPVSWEVRRRIREMVSECVGGRNERVVEEEEEEEEEMNTRAEVPGGEDEEEEEVEEGEEREEFAGSLTQAREEEGREEEEEKVYSEAEENQEAESQEWFDDDFGLSQTRREAEELRLQQLQIEQEIQQLQAQQEHVPYFYLREIPNKPPPPYTPPGKPLSEIPAAEEDILAITSAAVGILAEEMKKGKEMSDIEPGWEYYGNAASEDVRCYKFFLFDLAKHIIAEVLAEQEKKEEVLPWLRVPERLSKYKYRSIGRTAENLNEHMRKQVLVLFGFSKKLSKESLLVKWIKKKRDHVDEILVGESQEEESQWTQYDEDQVVVKNEVAMSILDDLLGDTAHVIDAIFTNKAKKK